MAYNNNYNKPANSHQSGFGIGPYDYVEFTYTGSEIETASYYRGGAQNDSQNLIAVLEYSYDSSGNLTSTERTS